MSAASNNHDGKTKSSATVRSPCINVCMLDAGNVCEGCYRTVSEIQSWSTMSTEEQTLTLTKTWERARAAGHVL